MSEEQRDQTMVTVNLDKQRMYRVNDSDTQAVNVGPGPAQVPKWVAEHWGLAPKGSEADVQAYQQEQAEKQARMTAQDSTAANQKQGQTAAGVNEGLPSVTPLQPSGEQPGDATEQSASQFPDSSATEETTRRKK